jgi:hypothetical protein
MDSKDHWVDAPDPIIITNDQTEGMDQLRLDIDNLTFQFDEIMEKLEQLTNMVSTLMQPRPEMPTELTPATANRHYLKQQLKALHLDPDEYLRKVPNEFT